MLNKFIDSIRRILGWENEIFELISEADADVEREVMLDHFYVDDCEDLDIQQPTHLSYKFMPRPRRKHNMVKK